MVIYEVTFSVHKNSQIHPKIKNIESFIELEQKNHKIEKKHSKLFLKSYLWKL